MDINVGQIVVSKCGHDKDETFIVLSAENDFVYLVDGRLRPLDNPKKKKIKHIQSVNYIDEEVKDKIQNEIKITNAELRDAIQNYKNNKTRGNSLGKE